MAKINEILRELLFKRENGNQAEAARKLKMRPQTIGNYFKEREPSPQFIQRWREVYGDDILALSSETNEDKSNEKESGAFTWLIEKGDYIGMHKRAFNELELTGQTHRNLLIKASDREDAMIRELARLIDKLPNYKEA